MTDFDLEEIVTSLQEAWNLASSCKWSRLRSLIESALEEAEAMEIMLIGDSVSPSTGPLPSSQARAPGAGSQDSHARG
jgi:hypothetical protein